MFTGRYLTAERGYGLGFVSEIAQTMEELEVSIGLFPPKYTLGGLFHCWAKSWTVIYMFEISKIPEEVGVIHVYLRKRVGEKCLAEKRD